MSEIWVVVDHEGGEPRKVSSQMLTAARDLGGDVVAVYLGSGFDAAKDKLAAFGASKALVAEVADGTQPSIDALAALISERSPAVVLVASSDAGKDLAGGVAAKVGAGVLADVVGLEGSADALVATKSAFGGATSVKCRVKGSPQIICVKANAFVAEESVAALSEERLSLAVDEPAAHIVESVKTEAGGRPNVEEASVIVSGGRGVAGAENFALIEALADQLGAGVGASRAAVDAGWYPHQHQVGQTGKTVSPSLYIACGISGAVQHLAGMKDSKTIVAINKDAEAPIFQVADYGLVADLFKAVPEINEKL